MWLFLFTLRITFECVNAIWLIWIICSVQEQNGLFVAEKVHYEYVNGFCFIQDEKWRVFSSKLDSFSQNSRVKLEDRSS